MHSLRRRGLPAPGLETVPSAATMNRYASGLLRLRTAAKSHFGQQVLSAPVWGVLLALFSEPDEGVRRNSITAIAKRADIPRSTALRALTDLQARGFVSLDQDDRDKRVICVELTAQGRSAMEGAFIAAQFI